MAGDIVLNGVHHTARPTWKLRETLTFYRDILGLKLVHCVSARGWGPSNHPDFLHFFFDSGAGSTIAFFYYLGDDQPDHLVHRQEYDNDAIHTAWRVETREELMAWRQRLEEKGVDIMYQIEHEVVESIYFRDPNGYYLEIGRPIRSFTDLDNTDSETTLAAALDVEDRKRAENQRLIHIENVWREKGDRLITLFGNVGAVCIFVPDFPEFDPFLKGAEKSGDCRIVAPQHGYWRIEADNSLQINRKLAGLGPALWNNALAGGFKGSIRQYDRNDMIIVPRID